MNMLLYVSAVPCIPQIVYANNGQIFMKILIMAMPEAAHILASCLRAPQH